MLYTILSVIAFVLLVYLLFKKSFSNTEGNVKYIQKGDPEAQQKYFNLKFPSIQSLSAKELLELSWKFLYDITEIVLNRFSVRSQKELMKYGRVMVKHGMKYQHVVDSNPRVIESYKKASPEKKQDSGEMQR